MNSAGLPSHVSAAHCILDEVRLQEKRLTVTTILHDKCLLRMFATDVTE